MSFSPDGKRLVAGQFDGDVIEYETATRRRARLLHVDSVVTGVAFHPDGKRIAVGTIDGRVRLLDLERKTTVGLPLDARSAAVWQVAFSPDGRQLAVVVDPNGGGDGFYLQQRQGEVQLWDVGSRRLVGKDRAGRRIGVLRGLQSGRHAAGDRQRRAAGPVGRRRPGAPRHVDEGLGRRRPERRVRSERLARRRRRSDRTGARVACGRSAPGLSSPRGAHRSHHRRRVRPGRRVPRNLEPARRDPALGPRDTGLGYGDELAGSTRSLGPRAPSIDSSRSWGCATRSARTASCWPSRESTHAGCCGTSTRRSGAERACAIVGRNLSLEEWALYLPSGTSYRATCAEWPTS